MILGMMDDDNGKSKYSTYTNLVQLENAVASSSTTPTIHCSASHKSAVQPVFREAETARASSSVEWDVVDRLGATRRQDVGPRV